MSPIGVCGLEYFFFLTSTYLGADCLDIPWEVNLIINTALLMVQYVFLGFVPFLEEICGNR